MPQWTPTQRELDDLDLVTLAVTPDPSWPTGFTRPEGSGGVPGLTLVVPADVALAAHHEGHLDLLDPEGVPLARLTPQETYAVPERDGPDLVGLVGPVERLAHTEYGPFRRYVHPPTEPEQRLAVPVVAALSADDVSAIAEAAVASRLRPVLLACAGAGSPRELSGPGLVRATLAAAGRLPDAEVVAVPLARRDPDGPETAGDEALRDRVAAAYGAAVHHPTYTGDLAPEVAAVVDADRPPRSRRGLVVFFTGLSGSGKSTIARALYDTLLERGDRTVTSLDGDVVRHHLSKGLGFSREDRETNIRRIGWVGAEISRHGGVAICSPIAPFDATRQEVRRMTAAAGGGFVLVHVATPLEECERRDRKGLYARARAGEIPDFTGISSPYEEPADADLRVDTTGRSVEECLDEVLGVLADADYVPRRG